MKLKRFYSVNQIMQADPPLGLTSQGDRLAWIIRCALVSPDLVTKWPVNGMGIRMTTSWSFNKAYSWPGVAVAPLTHMLLVWILTHHVGQPALEKWIEFLHSFLGVNPTVLPWEILEEETRKAAWKYAESL